MCILLIAKSLINVFINNTKKILINTSINENNFGYLHGFGMICDFNTSYYVIDFNTNNIVILNDSYGYVTKKTFAQPTYILTMNANLYITGQNNIWKTDKNLNILITYNGSGASYRDINFNLTENLIYVAPMSRTYLEVFDLNLTLKYQVNLTSNQPHSFSECNNELYVGTIQGSVLVIVNKVIIRSFTGCSGSTITSMVFDDFGLMAISCIFNNTLNLYDYNGTFTGKSLPTPSTPQYVGFDSKGRFVLISQFKISIYY